MASLFKKTFAVVLALAMVFTCLTANAANEAPSISVSTGYVNSNETDVSLEISTDNFDAIYGSDFTLTIPEGYRFESIESNFWKQNSNYVVNGQKIRFLDVRTGAGFTFTLNLTKTDAAQNMSPVTLAENMFVDANEAKHNVTLNNGVISIKNTTVGEGDKNVKIEDQPGYFIPYGSVWDVEKKEYASKGEDGKFAGGSTVSYYKLPTAEIGVTTFDYSVKKDTDDNHGAGVQFGSYAVNTADKKYGTLVIMGDFDGFKNVYNTWSDTRIYNQFAVLYNNHKPDDGTLKIKYATDKTITIALVAQTKYMWKGTVDEVEHIQYAVRVTQPTPRTYTSVAYSVSGDDYTFSKEASDYTYTVTSDEE